MNDYNRMTPAGDTAGGGRKCANCRMDVSPDASVCPNCNRCPSCGYSTDPEADRPCPNADVRGRSA